jgi:hypothetical protein
MKSKTSATLMLVLTFALGAVAGAVAYYLFNRHIAASQRARVIPHDVVEELSKGLSLNAEQKEKLRTIIQNSRDRYRALSQQFRPQYEAIRGETRQQIREILSEDQKALFERHIKELEERHKGRSPRPFK